MFKKRISVTILHAKETRRKRKKGDEDQGDLLLDLALEMPITIPLAKDLGPGVVALIKSRDANDPKVLPFKKATLPDEYEGLKLSVYDGRGVKFEATACKVSSAYLERSKDKPGTAVFGCILRVPPVTQAMLNHMVNAVGTEVGIALVQSQTELEV
jgi:hypothetical protein